MSYYSNVYGINKLVLDRSTKNSNLRKISFFVLLCSDFQVALFLFVMSFLSKRVQVSGQLDTYKLNHEKQLIEDLFANYQVKFGRPVNNMTERVDVYFGIYLIQLIDLVSRLFFLLNLCFFVVVF